MIDDAAAFAAVGTEIIQESYEVRSKHGKQGHKWWIIVVKRLCLEQADGSAELRAGNQATGRQALSMWRPPTPTPNHASVRKDQLVVEAYVQTSLRHNRDAPFRLAGAGYNRATHWM
jgi:hypothetical protein